MNLPFSVNKILREIVALGFVTAILGVWIAAFFDPSVSEARPVAMAFVDTAFSLFVLAAGYVVFGPRIIESAFDLLQRIRGGDTPTSPPPDGRGQTNADGTPSE